MSEKDNTTHEEKVVKLLQTIVCMQGHTLSLAIAQTKDVSSEYMDHLTASVESLMKGVDFE